VEFLFTCREHECLAAIAAGEGLVSVAHAVSLVRAWRVPSA
jgi:hypothetical protein